MAKDTNSENTVDAREEGLRAGLWILLMLTVLTLGEYLVAVITSGWDIILWLIAIWKAIYVVKDYMHIGRLSGEEEAH